MTTSPASFRARCRQEWPVFFVPILAALLVLPLVLHGPSCGHDFGFHVLSWLDAGAQIRHGRLLPSWAYAPAYNAGEPRFVFYPPLSWLLGSVLMMAVPANLAPVVFTWCALTLAGWAMYGLGRRFAQPSGALLAAALYIATPYMLFTAFERTAFAELLAAAWMPWLLRAALDEPPPVLAVAVPLALLWLTNAPAAVMGTYAFVFTVLLRLFLRWFAGRKQTLEAREWRTLAWPIARNAGSGLALGLLLTSFYLVPAAWERRYVQIAMAIIPNMRVEDNFLFGHTGYGPHDQVLHTASIVAMLMIGLAVLAVALGIKRGGDEKEQQRQDWTIFAVFTCCLSLLMVHFTLPLWHLLPELAFLQFPWRWLTVLGCVFGAGMAMACGKVRVPLRVSLLTALIVAAVASPLALQPFRQGCEAHELPQDRLALFEEHHGVEPTDEYTPTDADNDQLRWHDPSWWLADSPNTPAPGTVPNPGALDPDYDQAPPVNQTIAGFAPMHLHLDLPRPEDLVLNLRAYPAWVVRVNGRQPTWVQRDDGLVALALPAGADDVSVHWRRLPDVYAGDALSCMALCAAAWIEWRSRRIGPRT